MTRESRAATQRWLTVTQAATLLGVDEGTLRHWADQGKVPTFRTPGSHRRFRESDIRQLLAPTEPNRGELTEVLRRQTGHLINGLPARRLLTFGWFSSVDETFRARARERGRRLLDLLVQAAGGEETDRRNLLPRIRTLAREYGLVLHQANLPLRQAIEAFCFFRDLALTKTVRATPKSDQMRVMRTMNQLLDQILLGVVAVYESRSENGTK